MITGYKRAWDSCSRRRQKGQNVEAEAETKTGLEVEVVAGAQAVPELDSGPGAESETGHG